MEHSSEKLPPGTLCYVCEDLASGRHYNIPSCSGCKTFFRRAITNNRVFKCNGNGNCPVNKDVRCACRSCRLVKCLAVGMDKNAIQNARDRIGYTKRTRRNGTPKQPVGAGANIKRIKQEHESSVNSEEDETLFSIPGTSQPISNGSHHSDPISTNSNQTTDPMLERLTLLENNFSLLLSRAEIQTYASLDEALSAPSIFAKPITISMNDPIATPKQDKQKMPFWRSRIITLYIDWAKTFSAFRKLPHSDQVALITNHASSFMICCEAFRTPEKISPNLINSTHYFGGVSPSSGLLYSSPVGSNKAPEATNKVKVEQSDSSPDGMSEQNGDGTNNVHHIFDPSLIPTGTNCALTGIRSLVDVPSSADYPTVGSLSGLAPVMSAMISFVMKPFRRLNITTTEFAVLQAICFFDPDTEGLDSASQRNVMAEQKKFLAALFAHIGKNYDPVAAAERYSSIILRIPTIRKVAAKKNESLQLIDIFSCFSLNALVKETALGIRQAPVSTPSIKCEKN